jgi:hypothetical protein
VGILDLVEDRMRVGEVAPIRRTTVRWN